MTGKFVNEQLHAKNDAHGRWYIELLDPITKATSKIHYHDARNFGTLKFCLSKEMLDAKLLSLGPDVLDAQNTTEDVFLAIVSQKNPTLNVCRFLMNQEVSVFEALKWFHFMSFCQIVEKAQNLHPCHAYFSRVKLELEWYWKLHFS